MKRVRCPKCDNYIIFDETKYQTGQSLVFQCDKCGKQFGIRINTPSQPVNSNCGSIIVIENVFHFKQELPLHMGDNVIGKYLVNEDATGEVFLTEEDLSYVSYYGSFPIKLEDLKYIHGIQEQKFD